MERVLSKKANVVDLIELVIKCQNIEQYPLDKDDLAELTKFCETPITKLTDSAIKKALGIFIGSANVKHE